MNTHKGKDEAGGLLINFGDPNRISYPVHPVQMLFGFPANHFLTG
jgi:hypothetical protein